MTTLTEGHIRMSRLWLDTADSLSDVLQGMRRGLYAGVLTEGWGSISDTNDGLGVFIHSRPSPGRPAIVKSLSGGVDRLEARYYFDVPDRARMFSLGGSADPHDTHRLAAIDFVLIQGNNGIDVLVGTQDASSMRGTVPRALTRLGLNPASQQLINQTPFEIPDELFLWAVWKYNSSPDLTANFRIDEYRSVHFRDPASRRVSMTEEATLDRPALLAAICDGSQVFGPAKLGLDVKSLDLYVDVEFFADGSFSPHVGMSFYRKSPLARAALGRRLVLDTALEVIPELIRSFNADRRWAQAEKAAFVRDAKRRLRQITT